MSCETQGAPNGRYDELSIEEWVKSVPFDLVIGLESAEMFALMEIPVMMMELRPSFLYNMSASNPVLVYDDAPMQLKANMKLTQHSPKVMDTGD